MNQLIFVLSTSTAAKLTGTLAAPFTRGKADKRLGYGSLPAPP